MQARQLRCRLGARLCKCTVSSNVESAWAAACGSPYFERSMEDSARNVCEGTVGCEYETELEIMSLSLMLALRDVSCGSPNKSLYL